MAEAARDAAARAGAAPDRPRGVITLRGAELPRVPAYVALVQRELLVAPASLGDPFPKKFRVYMESPSRLVVPLHWARGHGIPLDDARPPGEDAALAFAGELREDLRQPEAVDAVLDAWGRADAAMLCLPVGQGKTVVALHLAARLRKKTLVLVHKSFLKEQWACRARQYLPGARVTEIQGDVCDTSGDVVVAMIQTLVSRSYPSRVFEPFGAVVVDECFPYRQAIATEHGPMRIGAIYDEWRAGRTVRVHSFDERAQRFVPKPVTHAWRKTASELVRVRHSGGEGFESTPDHPVLTVDGWRPAGTLRPGDRLVARLSARAGVLTVGSTTRFVPDDPRVYDIEVDGTHTFVACGPSTSTGPVVHNCHHVAAAVFSRAMFGLCARRVLCLTATPDRKDGLSRVLGWFAGPTAMRVRREGQASTVVRTLRYSCAAFDRPPPVNRRGDVCFASVIGRLTEQADRTRAVAAAAAGLTREGRDVLVLTHRRAHAADVAAEVRALGVECGTYLGGDRAAPDTRVIVATYALTSEGFDMPRLTALVLATPASDVEQSCGRVMRGAADAGAVIVDVVDRWGVCFAQHAKRRAFYRRSGFTMAAGGDDEGPPPPPAAADVDFVDE